jgi:hypothetical protein
VFAKWNYIKCQSGQSSGTKAGGFVHGRSLVRVQVEKGSGGSGGEQLTRSLEDTGSDAPSTKADLVDEATPVAPEGAGSAATAATRGAQDTHSQQAGSTPTGLGAPEAGATQQVSDLPPPPRK